MAASRSLQRDRESTGDSAGVSGRAGWANERATPALYWLPTAALPSGRASALRGSLDTGRGAASGGTPLRAAPSPPRREWDFTASGKVNTKREAAQPRGGAHTAHDRSRAAISVAAHALAPARAYTSLPLPSGDVRSTRLHSLISSNRELLLSLQRRGRAPFPPVAQTRSADEEEVQEEEALPWWGEGESPEVEPPVVAVLRDSRRSSSARAHPGRLSSQPQRFSEAWSGFVRPTSAPPPRSSTLAALTAHVDEEGSSEDEEYEQPHALHFAHAQQHSTDACSPASVRLEALRLRVEEAEVRAFAAAEAADARAAEAESRLAAAVAEAEELRAAAAVAQAACARDRDEAQQLAQQLAHLQAWSRDTALQLRELRTAAGVLADAAGP